MKTVIEHKQTVKKSVQNFIEPIKITSCLRRTLFFLHLSQNVLTRELHAHGRMSSSIRKLWRKFEKIDFKG